MSCCASGLTVLNCDTLKERFIIFVHSYKTETSLFISLTGSDSLGATAFVFVVRLY